MARPVIALLTDFGVRDHYVGAMKGVILGICPEATLVDVSHEVPAHDVATAAQELADAYEFFPPRTIFLAVVDPGVGSERGALAAETGVYRFVAPDNGLLSIVFDRSAPDRIVQLTDPQYARAEVSRTFEGRDRLGPAAAWMASGVDLSALGPPVDAIARLEVTRPEIRDGRVAGQVVRVDRFGNLVTNIDRQSIDALGRADRVVITIGSCRLSRLVGTYADVSPGDICALIGSSNRLEIAVNGSSAAAILSIGRGAPVLISAAL